MSIRPKCSWVEAARRLVSSSFDTSIPSARASPPRFAISCTTSWACASRMSPTTTLAPSRANRRAYSRPMPWLAPVMMATLSFKRMVVLLCLTRSLRPGSWDRLDLELEGRRAGVRDVRLPPDLDRERHHDERVQELEQPARVVGQLMERKFVQVGDRLLGAREDRVVERLHLVHRARQALRVAFGLAGQAPCLGEGLEVGEFRG